MIDLHPHRRYPVGGAAIVRMADEFVEESILVPVFFLGPTAAEMIGMIDRLEFDKSDPERFWRRVEPLLARAGRVGERVTRCYTETLGRPMVVCHSYTGEKR